MARRCIIRLCLLGSLLGGWPLSSQAHDTLIWLLRDLPPVTIFEGPQKGQGALDQLLPILAEHMPEYRQQILHVNRARGMQMLRDPGTLTCDPSLLWTAERAKTIVFSAQAFASVSNGVTIRESQRAVLAPFVVNGAFDLEAFLNAREARLGIVAERSYGTFIDQALTHASPHKLAPHYGNDALGSLLQMQRKGRLEALLGYWTEVRYQALQQGIDPQDLIFYPIKGTPPYQLTRIACTDNPAGRAAIERIDQVLHEIPQEQLRQSYASWLDPVMREQYLNDNPTFFQDAPAP
ncbi:TIGR02285 family protein [Pseudomonas sp. Bout1]|uniref:TIGR02285 family protein n=1 Tax=Pseudomonas sp. Bout1 TaxID=3048600 RepID=UPI002AB42221|nr:TIGR02285 family protein [Pseudomonas sp. Bout1]MDY7531164.1 TIGR02285 family protein [Pseudomonas sp. Bout1]MEB0187305.1 TIGR02285 family protein [Pseudomonas sp. Bout1]